MSSISWHEAVFAQVRASIRKLVAKIKRNANCTLQGLGTTDPTIVPPSTV